MPGNHNGTGSVASSHHHHPRTFRSNLVLVLSRFVSCIFYLLLCCLAASLPQLNQLSSQFYDFLSFLLGAPPLRSIQPRQSAIVILGADAEIGSAITLRLSELGYTIFALFPVQCETPSGQVGSMMSSLIYEWHCMKERARRQDTLGIVIPITLDMKIQDQRKRAFETVHAYCAGHSLCLAALILSPPGLRDNHTAAEDVLSHKTSAKIHFNRPKAVSDLLCDNLSEVLAGEIIAPLLVARDYLSMLQESQGRFLVISGCLSHSSIPGMVSTPFDGTRLSIFHSLKKELQPEGISATLITSAPLRPRAGKTNGVFPGITHPSNMGLAKTLSLILSRFSIPEEQLVTTIQRVMLARYPKSSYSVGVHPYLSGILDSDIVKLFIHVVATETCM